VVDLTWSVCPYCSYDGASSITSQPYHNHSHTHDRTRDPYVLK
jgi:hypothetical protein